MNSTVMPFFSYILGECLIQTYTMQVNLYPLKGTARRKWESLNTIYNIWILGVKKKQIENVFLTKIN